MITHAPAASQHLPPMTPTQTVIAVILLVLVLWVAYRIGKVILQVVAGLLFLGLAGYGIWYLLIR
ncbi:hypothetical protein [Mesoterricola silvestris]|uniref:Uncharacterized protein n=1 Tax=Mesoterricola silvestris TaxID=2927979 RepID=A0AA48K9M1_9BACT|nr:hypothetical protein [Mesoterricola silvestris]BDU72472.1 hypothetical protein METEAL_16460 [Mesoterricola silvestris]